MSHSTPRAPRLSGIPTPGRPSISSGLPTPSNRKVSLPPPLPNKAHLQEDDHALSLAFTDAIRQNPLTSFRPTEASSPASQTFGGSSTPSAHPPRRPSSSASSNRSYLSSSSTPSLPRTPGHPSLRSSHFASSSNGYPSTPTPGTSQPRTGPRKSLLASSSARSESRLEDRATPKGAKAFVVGDRVRIDSMGMEGVLAYVGEIKGKPGVWAGVELGGGFAGKGKNDGSVGDTQYFICPENCGVFLQYSKLSSPTTGSAYPRPTSVASNRSSVRGGTDSGRFTPSTPSISGRSTPSVSGRATPSISGRATPSQTPRLTTKRAQDEGTKAEGTITAGSRASKYVGMTAKQLKDRATEGGSTNALSKSTTTPRPARVNLALGQPTPTRPTPRQSLGGASFSSSSHATPGRLSRSTTTAMRSTPTSEMPPPPSPSKLKASLAVRPPSRQSEYSSSSVASRPHSRTSELTRPPTPKAELETTSSALNDKIAHLMRSSSRASDYFPDSPAGPSIPPFPSSQQQQQQQTGTRSEEEWTKQKSRIDQLLIRVDSLEKENLGLLLERQKTPDPALFLSSGGGGGQVVDPGLVSALESRAINAERQVQACSTKLTILESELSAASQSSRTLQTTIEEMERAASQAEEERVREQKEAKGGLKDVLGRLEEREAEVKALREAVGEREEGEHAHDAEVLARKKEVEGLQAKVVKLGTSLEQERTELGAQIEALRRAGQETIMLYEERLNAAESMRLDMESFLHSKEEELAQSTQRQVPPHSTGESSPKEATALEIDNENLTEQVTHLNRRIASFEEQIEEYQVQIEADEAAAKNKLDQAVRVENGLRKEIGELRAQIEELGKSEAAATARVADIEEALRENHVALENARGEIEGLRAEVANLENSQEGPSSSERTDRIHEVESKLAAARVQFEEEIGQLKGMIDELTVSRDEALEAAAHSKLELEQRMGEVEDLREAVESLETMVEEKIMAEEDGLDKDLASTKLTEAHAKEITELRKALAEAQANLEVRTHKHESEFSHLQSRVAEIDLKNQQEVLELENLIESKIYREDELEREIEDLKYKLAQSTKSKGHSRGSTEETSTPRMSSFTSRTGNGPETCELCDNPEHEIQDCPLFNGSSSSRHSSPRSDEDPSGSAHSPLTHKHSKSTQQLVEDSTDSRPWCDDCETFGHPTEECEYAQEMF